MRTKASRGAKAALILGVLGAAVGVLNIVLLFTVALLLAVEYILLGYLAITGIAAAVIGLMARGKLKGRDPAAARKATIGAGFGTLGLVLLVVSSALVFVPMQTVILDGEEAHVDPESGASHVFEITAGRWTMTYDIQGATGDSFTVCIVPEGNLQTWMGYVQQSNEFGEACNGPGARAQGTARLQAGTYELAAYCWNTAAACQLTWNLEGEPYRP